MLRRDHDRARRFALGTSGEPILDGFRAIFGSNWAKGCADSVTGWLQASTRSSCYAGRSTPIAGRLLPAFLSVTRYHKTPHCARGGGLARTRGDAGGVVRHGWRRGGVVIAACCSTWRVGAMFSYFCKAPLHQVAPELPKSSGRIIARSVCSGDADVDHRARDPRPPARDRYTEPA